GDWSSDVCSSDLGTAGRPPGAACDTDRRGQRLERASVSQKRPLMSRKRPNDPCYNARLLRRCSSAHSHPKTFVEVLCRARFASCSPCSSCRSLSGCRHVLIPPLRIPRATTITGTSASNDGEGSRSELSKRGGHLLDCF